MPPCDFHMFGELKRALKAKRFTSGDDVQGAVQRRFQQQPKNFHRGIQRLVSEWGKCLNSCGDYV